MRRAQPLARLSRQWFESLIGQDLISVVGYSFRPRVAEMLPGLRALSINVPVAHARFLRYLITSILLIILFSSYEA